MKGENMTIPSFMPVLSAGKHRSPEQGACVMEYISFLAGERWTDLPSCTNETLAKAAQYVNDDLPDEDRHRLIPLIGRLMGARESSHEINDALMETAADYVQSLLGHPDETVHTFALDAQRTWGSARAIILAAEIAVHVSGGDTVALLSALIDEYDRVTGRTEPAPVTEEDLRRCAELTGATR